MRSIFSTVVLTAVLSTFVSSPVQAAALPHEARAASLDKRAPPFPDDTVIRNAHIDFAGPAIFFSNLPPTAAGRAAPDDFAKIVNGRTFKDAFGKQPPPNQDKSFTDRWRGGSGAAYRDFAARFSRIFAEKVQSDTAFVMLRALDGPDAPRVNSVWTVHEFPALQNNPNVQRVIRVNPSDFNDRQQIFPVVPAAPVPTTPVPVPAPATTQAQPSTAAVPAPPQLNPRKVGVAKGKPTKPATTKAPVRTTKAPPPPPPPTTKAPSPPPPTTSKAPPQITTTSKATVLPPSSKVSSAPPPIRTSSGIAPPVVSSKASSSAATVTGLTTTAPAVVSSKPTSLAGTPTSFKTTTTQAAVLDSPSSSAIAPSSLSGTTTLASTPTSGSLASPSSLTTSATITSAAAPISTISSSVVMDWDFPVDGPYYAPA